MIAPAVRTTCPYCGVGCGVLAQATGSATRVWGDPEHPANAGRLCSKGAALADTVSLTGRLLYPTVDGRTASWEAALARVARGFAQVIEQHGPDAVAFYVSGQILTEDYYVANKLMKGFIGSANIDTNSRLCMASSVAGHRRAFGEDLVPVVYEDLESADLVVLVGSNLAWCHPVLYQRLAQAKQARPGMRVVVIDPRRTPTCDFADLHLAVRSGCDVLLFNGLLHHLHAQGLTDKAFVAAHTTGAARALLLAHNTAGEAAAVARGCGLEPQALEQFYAWFAATPRVVTAFSQGVNQSSAGTDKVNAIINVHLLTGRIGRSGAGPFSITGQPNAMGGREVGGLANTLAAHMELDNPAHRARVQAFWAAPRIAARPGLKAVDLFEAIHAGRVRAVWIMATNPLVSLPNADRARAALARCDLVVVSDVIADTDTARHAHVLLPALAWGEKDGTVTNSQRDISRQRAFLPAAGEARPDWWALAQVGRRMGYEAQFDYGSAQEIFDEHARLSALDNDGERRFDLAPLVGLGAAGYADLPPTRWPSTAPLFADGRFAHPDGRARFVAVAPRAPRHSRDAEYPLILNTGRIRDQWHTMTRTGRAARLSVHIPEPFVDLHPGDAHSLGVQAGHLARVSTRWGDWVGRVRVGDEVARGTLFVPIHWSAATASHARTGVLVSPSVDELSGEPEFKHTPARIEAFAVSWHGLALSRGALAVESLSYWARVQETACLRYELAGRGGPGRWTQWARKLLQAPSDGDWIEYVDGTSGTYRAAWFAGERLEACLFVAPRPALPDRAWAAAWFEQPGLRAADRAALLSTREPAGASAAGPLICACFGVHRQRIEAAIAQGDIDPGAVGRRLRAGTNCGSCVPEIRKLIAARPLAVTVATVG